MNQEGRLFRYLVVDSGGAKREITLHAPDAGAARRRLKQQGCVALRELNETPEARSRAWFGARRSGKFDVVSFTNRLSPLLSANVPLERALLVCEEGAPNEATRELVFELRRKLHEGVRFSELIRAHEKEFPPIYAGLIETGEETGSLPEVTAELRRFLTESKEFKEFVITSSIYPLSVVAVTVSVVVILFTVFIPRFARIFEDMGRELPALTRWMLAISNFMVAHWYLLVLAVAGGVWFYRQLRRPAGRIRRWWDQVSLKIPLAGPLIVSVQIGNFLEAMAIMAKNHVHLLHCFDIAERTLSNTAIRAGLAPVAGQLRDGGKLSEILGRVAYLPQGTAAMLKVAEESGDLGSMFERIAREEQDATRLKFKRLLVLLEPAVIVVLAVMVLLVVLAVFMAIWKMNSIR